MAVKQTRTGEVEQVEPEPRVVGDALPNDAAYSGSEPPAEPDPLKERTTVRGNRRARSEAKKDTTPPVSLTGAVEPEVPKVTLPARASKIAVDGAGDLYALTGTIASVAGFPMAGLTMQAQKNDAGKVIANHALAHWPRMYSFLENTAKASAIVPLVLCPFAAELYMRTENPQVEILCSGILSQYLEGMTVSVPNPESPDGQSQVDVWESIRGLRQQVSAQQQAYRDMQPPPMEDSDFANMNGEPESVPDEDLNPMAKILRGDGWDVE